MIYPRAMANLPANIRKNFEYSIATVQPISGLSVVIPIRGIERQNNLNYCISKLLQQNVEPIEIIVSEEDQFEKINLTRFSNDSRVRKIFTKSGPRPFNKSIAVNSGVGSSVYSKILMNDADIIVPKGYFSKIDISLNEYDVCFFGKEIYNVDLLKNGIMWRGSKRVDYFSGGSIGFTKSAFVKIGGMCEQFYGYGSEDCEFWERVTKITKLYENRDSVFLHLNHKRENTYSQNADLYNNIISLSMENRLEQLRNDYQKRTGWRYDNV
jgi:predicted glycosyltransferase involved in capsule biosynthesis